AFYLQPSIGDRRQHTYRADADGAYLETLVVHRLAFLVCPHDLDQVVLGDGVARLAAEDVFEARLGAALIVQPHEIDLWIIDAPAREGIDVDVSLIPGRNSHGQSIPFQEALIDAVNLLDEWQLEMQAGFRDWIALRFAKLSYN